MSYLTQEEQENLNILKYFWRDYGRYLAGLIIIFIIAYCSKELWVFNSKQQAIEANKLYNNILILSLQDQSKDNSINSSDNSNHTITNKNQLTVILDNLQKSYPKTLDAANASLLMAKYYFKHADLNNATKNLLWVISNARDKGLVAQARLRVADVYMEEKNYVAAIKVLQDNQTQAYAQIIKAKIGDVYMASEDLTNARQNYKDAAKLSSSDPALDQMIQLKLDVLGD